MMRRRIDGRLPQIAMALGLFLVLLLYSYYGLYENRNRLQDENADLQRRLEGAQSEHRRAANGMDVAQREVGDWRAKTKRLEDLRVKDASKLRVADNEVKTLKAARSELMRAVNDLERAQSELKSRLNTRTELLQKADDELSVFKVEVEEVKESKLAAEASLGQMRQERDANAAHVNEMKQALEAAKQVELDLRSCRRQANANTLTAGSSKGNKAAAGVGVGVGVGVDADYVEEEKGEEEDEKEEEKGKLGNNGRAVDFGESDHVADAKLELQPHDPSLLLDNNHFVEEKEDQERSILDALAEAEYHNDDGRKAAEEAQLADIAEGGTGVRHQEKEEEVKFEMEGKDEEEGEEEKGGEKGRERDGLEEVDINAAVAIADDAGPLTEDPYQELMVAEGAGATGHFSEEREQREPKEPKEAKEAKEEEEEEEEEREKEEEEKEEEEEEELEEELEEEMAGEEQGEGMAMTNVMEQDKAGHEEEAVEAVTRQVVAAIDDDEGGEGL